MVNQFKKEIKTKINIYVSRTTKTHDSQAQK